MKTLLFLAFFLLLIGILCALKNGSDHDDWSGYD